MIREVSGQPAPPWSVPCQLQAGLAADSGSVCPAGLNLTAMHQPAAAAW